MAGLARILIERLPPIPFLYKKGCMGGRGKRRQNYHGNRLHPSFCAQLSLPLSLLGRPHRSATAGCYITDNANYTAYRHYREGGRPQDRIDLHTGVIAGH